MLKKKLIGELAVALLSIGLVAAGTTAAQAASGNISGCTVYSNKPYKSGDMIRGTGSASCTYTANRTLFIEVHRSEGWWHPLVATNSVSGPSKSYSLAAQGCDTGGSTHRYFSEVGFGTTEINSGESVYLTGTC